MVKNRVRARRAGAGIVAASLIGGLSVAAEAAGNRHEGYDYAYAGDGVQYGEWSESNREIRLYAHPLPDMFYSRCMDSYVDWAVDQPLLTHQHYDARFVRSCLPGTRVQTDPGGNGHWSEPSDWEGEDPEGIQRGYGIVIKDSNLEIVHRERFEDVGTQPFEDPAPPTSGQGGNRVRTQYEGGNIVSCNPLPADVAEFQGCAEY